MIRRRSVIALSWAVCSTLLLAGAPRPSAGAALQPRLKGRLPVMGPPDRPRVAGGWHVGNDHQIFLDPSERRGYQFFLYATSAGGASSDGAFGFVQAFDADTLRPLGNARLHLAGNPRFRYIGQSNEDFLHALDQDRGLLYVAGSLDGDQGVFMVDLRTIGSKQGQKLTPVFLSPLDTAGPPTLLNGLTLTKRSPDDPGKLIVLWGPRNQRGAAATLQQWDVRTATGAPRNFSPDWGTVNNLRACSGTQNIVGPLVHSAKRSAVYGVCAVSTSLTSQSDYVPAAFRVTDPDSADNRQETFIGPTRDLSVILADAERERLFLASSEASEVLWGFDGPRGRFIGIAGLGVLESRTFGINRGNGRIYALTPHQQPSPGAAVLPGGLFTIDGRLTPMPQALRYPEFHGPSLGQTIRVLPAAGDKPALVFARRAVQYENETGTCDPNVSTQQCSNAGINYEYEYPGTGRRVVVPDDPYWMVIEDPVPVTVEPTPDDLDRLTADVPEQAGVTEASFEGTGSAYGFRVRHVGGMVPYAEDRCVADDREMFFGTVPEARLGTFEAAARSAGLLPNEAMSKDLARPASRCSSAPAAALKDQHETTANDADARLSEPSRAAREAQPAECSDEGQKAWDPPVSFAGGRATARVACHKSKESVDAAGAITWSQATATGSADFGTIGIAGAESSVTLTRQPGAGVVVDALAVTRGIEIPLGTAASLVTGRLPQDARTRLDTIRISVARSEVRVWSNGRPAAGSRAVLRRAVCGVSGPGLPEGPGSCATDDAQLNALVTRINSVLSETRSGWRVYLPQPDPDLARGSRGGYVAGIQKPTADRVDDQLVNGDFSYEVPALELRRIADNAQARRRQIYSFAAVRATATYGISLLATDSGVPQTLADGGGDGLLPSDPFGGGTGVLGTGIGRDDFGAGNGARPLVAIETLGRRIFGLLTRPAKETGLAGAVWLLLALPFFLAWRRGALSQSARTPG